MKYKITQLVQEEIEVEAESEEAALEKATESDFATHWKFIDIVEREVEEVLE